jgi:hypothetical protein
LAGFVHLSICREETSDCGGLPEEWIMKLYVENVGDTAVIEC